MNWTTCYGCHCCCCCLGSLRSLRNATTKPNVGAVDRVDVSSNDPSCSEATSLSEPRQAAAERAIVQQSVTLSELPPRLRVSLAQSYASSKDCRNCLEHVCRRSAFYFIYFTEDLSSWTCLLLLLLLLLFMTHRIVVQATSSTSHKDLTGKRSVSLAGWQLCPLAKQAWEEGPNHCCVAVPYS